MAPGIDLRDRFLGCLLGCAVGDALGAPYEGLWSHSIPPADVLLSDFAEFEGYPRGQYTDDTQLSLATVRAILQAGDVSPVVIARAIARLWQKEAVIGPGGACTRAAHTFLATGDPATCGAPVGQAGNGTAMRTAVLGLFFLSEPERLPSAVAEVSRITHQDLRSIAGGIAVAEAARRLASGESADRDLCEGVAGAMAPYERSFAEQVASLPALLEQDEATAIATIAWAGQARPELDRPIITPFVVPTVLASLWCLLRHADSWGEAVASAIGLGGDVDTLGAIVGALAGAALGVGSVPAHLAEGVVDAERVRGLAVRYHALVMARGKGEREEGDASAKPQAGPGWFH